MLIRGSVDSPSRVHPKFGPKKISWFLPMVILQEMGALGKLQSSPMQKDTEMGNDSNANEPETRTH